MEMTPIISPWFFYFAAKVEEGEDKDLLWLYEDNLDKFITIDQSKEYRAPRLHNNSADDSLYDVKETSLDGTFDSLDSDEKAFMEDEARRVVEKKITPNESSIVTDALYNNLKITINTIIR